MYVYGKEITTGWINTVKLEDQENIYVYTVRNKIH